ncbi:MAG: membrane dipeptidase [Oscillospiraceae bacterium]|nr:membrane dipeptidase [Oscillospiraceae bacterium]
MKFPVLDLHCDTALQLLGKNRDTLGRLDTNDLHIDLERGATLPGYAQCFAIFTTPNMRRPEGVSVIGMFERELAAIMSQVEENQDKIRVAYSAEEIEENRKQGIMSAVLTIEGTAGFDYNSEMLEDLYNIGFRITTLSWNEQNPLTGSCKTGGGLTEQGREYVRLAQKVGMVIDVSHISDEGFWDIMDITEKPIIASHSNSRALWDIPRNLSDEMYAALCKTGGTTGINLCAEFLGENADLDTVCDHIFHFMDIAGSDRHVSLGSDMDGITNLPSGFAGVQDYPKIADRLLQRGLPEESVENIFWNNAVGVIKKCSI